MKDTFKPYQIPDPRIRPDSFLTTFYKTLKSIEYDDRAWDKEYFARCNKRTAYLLEVFSGDIQAAAKCMQELKEKFEGDSINWTIETICQYSFEWKAAQQKITDRDMTRRFLGDLAQKIRVGDLKRVDIASILEKIKTLPAPKEEDISQRGISENRDQIDHRNGE